MMHLCKHVYIFNRLIMFSHCLDFGLFSSNTITLKGVDIKVGWGGLTEKIEI